MSVAPHKSWSHLNRDNESDGYVITIKDGDRIVLSYEELEVACTIAERRREFLYQFKELFELVDNWIRRHRSDIDRAYITLGTDGIDFTVIQRSTKFSREFNKSLIRLDVEIANDDRFNLINFDVLSLPFSSEEVVKSFVGGRGTLKRNVQD